MEMISVEKLDFEIVYKYLLKKQVSIFSNLFSRWLIPLSCIQDNSMLYSISSGVIEKLEKKIEFYASDYHCERTQQH